MCLQALQDRPHPEVVTQLTVGVPLGYMCAAAYYSLFKLGIFSFYYMVPHATDPHSLLMNAGQVSRFAAPLAFNFLHVVRMHEGLRNKQVRSVVNCLLQRGVQYPSMSLSKLQASYRSSNLQRTCQRNCALPLLFDCLWMPSTFACVMVTGQFSPASNASFIAVDRILTCRHQVQAVYWPITFEVCALVSCIVQQINLGKGPTCMRQLAHACSSLPALLTADKSLLYAVQTLVFAQKMGSALKDVPILNRDFNTWFPITLVIYCAVL